MYCIKKFSKSELDKHCASDEAIFKNLAKKLINKIPKDTFDINNS